MVRRAVEFQMNVVLLLIHDGWCDDGNSADKLRYHRSVAYSVELLVTLM